MQHEQLVWQPGQTSAPSGVSARAQLVLVFGARQTLEAHLPVTQIKQHYPAAQVVFVSSTGNIHGTQLTADTLVSTAIYFEKSRVQATAASRNQHASSYETGRQLVAGLPPEGLRHILLFTDGLKINPSKLILGINSQLPAGVQVTGGVAGDAWEFDHTLAGLNARPASGQAVAVGLYGPHLQVTYGVGGGWDSFGPDRLVTRAQGNILYELDGKPALELYCLYMGKYAEGHARAAMYFPLGVRSKDKENSIVRSVINTDERTQALKLAGDVQEGDWLRLMKASTERLLDGAACAAQQAAQPCGGSLALLISCVGRQAVLGQRAEEELEEVQQVLGEQTLLTGFYSYGEYAPFHGGMPELHNQTMTITVFSEK